ncbi:hypothetical protein QJS04_geneDACA015599 [Acorus gramineus]|uniref:Uncharacterized protein n=1 Tax=Acorus gramineus TaxID=55184 RepID=A0AAV9ARK4_ACOGR|nr:hypothetical protein QJS04_geneDACA015599 [Acorus gramineus]
MAGTVGSIVAVDPKVYVNSLSLSGVRFGPKKSRRTSAASVELSSPFVAAWKGWRIQGRWKEQRRRRRDGGGVVAELGGHYEEGFEDVQLMKGETNNVFVGKTGMLYSVLEHARYAQIINYFTQKAVRTVLYQLYEMNPPSYTWLYNYIAQNNATDGHRFIRRLAKERQELAERVMITRLHLYGKWIKKLDHAKMYERISDENLTIMRERLMETVIWPSDDSNTEKIG